MSALVQEATFPKADWPGAGGFAPFPCRDHLLGSGGCHPSNQYPGRAAGAGRAANALGPSSFPFLPSNQVLACLLCKGKSSLFEMSTDLIAKEVCPFLLLISPISRSSGKITIASSLQRSLFPSPATPLRYTEAFLFYMFSYMQPNMEEGENLSKSSSSSVFLCRRKISCTFVQGNAKLCFCKLRWWQFLNTVIFCR